METLNPKFAKNLKFHPKTMKITSKTQKIVQKPEIRPKFRPGIGNQETHWFPWLTRYYDDDDVVRYLDSEDEILYFFHATNF